MCSVFNLLLFLSASQNRYYLCYIQSIFYLSVCSLACLLTHSFCISVPPSGTTVPSWVTSSFSKDLLAEKSLFAILKMLFCPFFLTDSLEKHKLLGWVIFSQHLKVLFHCHLPSTTVAEKTISLIFKIFCLFPLAAFLDCLYSFTTNCV